MGGVEVRLRNETLLVDRTRGLPRRLFETILRRCIEEGLFGEERDMAGV